MGLADTDINEANISFLYAAITIAETLWDDIVMQILKELTASDQRSHPQNTTPTR